MANILYHKRFDISTEQFTKVKHLLSQAKSTGRPPLDNYQTLNAIFCNKTVLEDIVERFFDIMKIVHESLSKS